MSNDLTTMFGAVPSYVTTAVDPLTATMAKGMSATRNRISIRGNRWNLVHGSEVVQQSSEPTLDVVIVDVQPNTGRVYFDQAYDPNAKISPACRSNDGIRPDPASERRPVIKLVDGTQRPVQTCAECPMNQKGSAGGTRKACGFERRLAVVAAHDLSGPVYSIAMKAMTLFGQGNPVKKQMSYREYSSMLGQHRQGMPNGISPSALVTQLSFDMDATVPVLRFAPAPARADRPTWLSKEEFDLVVSRRTEQEVLDILNSGDEETQEDMVPTGVTVIQQTVPVAIPVAPTPEPLVDEAPWVETSQPVTPVPPAPPAVPTETLPSSSTEQFDPPLGINHPDIPQAWKAWAVAPGVTPDMVNEQLAKHFPQALEPVKRVATPPAPPVIEEPVVEKPKRTRKKATEKAPSPEVPEMPVSVLDELVSGDLANS